MELNKLVVYLAEGSLDGFVSAKYDEFPGRLIKVHNDHLDKNSVLNEQIKEEIDRLKRPGIYFLCGKNIKGVDAVYIGESDNVYDRLNEHSNDFKGGRKNTNWQTAFAYTREGLEKNKRLFLEYHFCQILKEGQGYECLTSKVEKPDLDYYDENNMFSAMKKIHELLNVVGADVLGEICTIKKEYITLYYKDEDNGIEAQGYYVDNNRFVVFQDSKISDIVPETLKEKCLTKRNEICSNGTVKNGRFVKDYSFESITQAARVISGRNVIGEKAWKTKEGISVEKGKKFIVSKE